MLKKKKKKDLTITFFKLSFSFISLQRITIAEIQEDAWFKKGYTPAQFEVEEDITLDDVDAAFSSSRVRILLLNNVIEPQINVVKVRVQMPSLLGLSICFEACG